MVGLPRAIIKKYGVTKKAWAVFRGRHKSRVSKHVGGKTRMVRRSYRRFSRKGHSGKSMIRSVEKIAGVGAFLYPAVSRGYAVWNAEHNAGRAVIEGLGSYAGIRDGRFDGATLMGAWTPFLAFNLVRGIAHKVNGLIRGL